MDPHLRLEIDAFLEDLFVGTDLEIALAKSPIEIRLKGDAEVTQDDIQNGISYVTDTILEMATDGAVMVREDMKGEPFWAVSLADLRLIIDEAAWGDE